MTETTTPKSGTCPTGCGRGMRTGLAMCRDCWGQVPRHLQREVNRTWGAWRQDFGDAELLHAYRAARESAIASVP